MADSRLPLLIVGGGIGGLAAALALSQAGRQVHVVERASDFGELGAGIQLAPNATRILARLGLLEDIKRHAVFPRRLVWMDMLRQQKITEIDLGAAFVARYGFPYLVMHRSDLLSVLLDACRSDGRITLESGREVLDVKNLDAGARAHCADGSVYDADVLIGADGIKSNVRPLISDDPLICAEAVAYRGTLPMSEMSTHAGLDNVVMWVGPDMHFVQYPVRRGELYNQVAVFRSERYRPDSEDWGTTEEFDARFAQACDYVKNCAKLMWRDRRWPMYDREPIPVWTRGSVALVGDAAHPMLQYVAQGACQAIEDAACLADVLGPNPADIPRALVRYQDIRANHAARVQRTARTMGQFFHLGGAAAEARNGAMAAKPATDYAALDWLYNERAL